MREKRPRGRPRQIREFSDKRPVGRPRKWTAENIADRPQYKPKDYEYYRKCDLNVVKPRLEAKTAESHDIHVQLHLMTVLLGTTIADIIELMRSYSLT